MKITKKTRIIKFIPIILFVSIILFSEELSKFIPEKFLLGFIFMLPIVAVLLREQGVAEKHGAKLGNAVPLHITLDLIYVLIFLLVSSIVYFTIFYGSNNNANTTLFTLLIYVLALSLIGVGSIWITTIIIRSKKNHGTPSLKEVKKKALIPGFLILLGFILLFFGIRMLKFF